MSSDPQKANLNPLHNLLLASASPRRKELLAELIPNFRVVSSDAEELTIHREGVVKLVQENARIKAEAVASIHPSSWVLGADTVVALGEKVFGKPTSISGAKEMLMELSGQSHQVHTGLCLIHTQSNYLECRKDTSMVHFRKLNIEVISQYYQTVNPLDKAGAYAIQTNADLIVEKFEGSYSNVVGLPLELLKSWLIELCLLEQGVE
jgi:septum formation protein